MSLTFYSGPNFSGRSAAMKDFAWSQGSKGQYLHPALEVNLSGFAATAGGEVRLHPPSDALPETLQAQLNAVVRNLPET